MIKINIDRIEASSEIDYPALDRWGVPKECKIELCEKIEDFCSEIASSISSYKNQSTSLVEKLKEESEELQKKYVKLCNFISDSQDFRLLSSEHKFLLKTQKDAMWSYISILNRRVELLDGSDKSN